MDDTGAGQAAPLVHEGVMFLPNPRGVVQALNAATGDLIWEYRTGLTPIAEGAKPITADELGDAAMVIKFSPPPRMLASSRLVL